MLPFQAVGIKSVYEKIYFKITFISSVKNNLLFRNKYIDEVYFAKNSNLLNMTVSVMFLKISVDLNGANVKYIHLAFRKWNSMCILAFSFTMQTSF